MKKILIVSAMLIMCIAANAQSNSIQIDTTDATIKYLLERIENLEHIVHFEMNNNALSIQSTELKIFINDRSNTQIGKRIIREYADAQKKKYKESVKLASVCAAKYKYTDQEMSVLDALCKDIEFKLNMLDELYNL